MPRTCQKFYRVMPKGNRAGLTVESKAILKLGSGKVYAVLLIYGNGGIETTD